MRAIILSAGKGERLLPLTRNMPKSLLEVGDGMTVLESQLVSLRQGGITDVSIVVGYKAEQIEAKIKDISELNVTTVYNPFFATTNNLISAWIARSYMFEDFLLINGDDIFSASVVESLLLSSADITMMIDRKDTYDDDDMKVVASDDRILQVSKVIPPSEANGESIGMIKFMNNGRELFRKTLDSMVRKIENHSIFYLAAIQQIINQGFPVHYAECEPKDWAEIDFHPDLATIRMNIDSYSERLKSWKVLFGNA